MFTDHLAGLFKEIPSPENSAEAPGAADFRSKVEAEIREALLGTGRVRGEYSTDRAFVLFPGPVPNTLRDALSAIPMRTSGTTPETVGNRLPAERTLRFKSDLEVGGVIFAAPAPAVYYQEWYSILLLDRVIHRVVPIKVSTQLQLTTRPYYYRIEAPVPAGQFPEPVEENLMQELQRLELTRAEPAALEAARADARAYLESKEAVEWFASIGIPERRAEGILWIQGMTADNVRVAVRDLLLANRVLAAWSPKARQAVVEVEDLGKSQAPRPSPAASQRPLPEGEAGPMQLPAFPQHSHTNHTAGLAEKLGSGVSLTASNINGVFVAGGTLTRYDRDFDLETLRMFQTTGPERILVLARPESMDRARQVWSSFKGNPAANTGVTRGNVASGDLPAIFLLKTLLDRKLIEAGLWGDTELKISASEGSTLLITGEANTRARILEWIRRFAMERPSDADIAWAREVGVHRLGTVQADLQALIWERDPQGSIQDLETVSAGHVQDVARIYF
jgi:hypothetical protein